MGSKVEEVYVYRSQVPNDKGLAQKFVKDLANDKIDAIIFTSSLGVKNFFKILQHIISEGKLKSLIEKKMVIVAIGPTTSRTLTEAGVKVDVMPKKYTLDEVLDALGGYWTA